LRTTVINNDENDRQTAKEDGRRRLQRSQRRWRLLRTVVAVIVGEKRAGKGRNVRRQ